MLFEVFIGKFAPITSSLIGCVAAVTLAIPSIRTIDSRRTLIELSKLMNKLAHTGKLNQLQEQEFDTALRELDIERTYYKWGLVLLGLSFLIMTLHSWIGKAASA